MSAGLSPRFGKKGVKAFVVGTTRTPVVEVAQRRLHEFLRFSCIDSNSSRNSRPLGLARPSRLIPLARFLIISDYFLVAVPG